ncbi:MAG: FRG domain-containing protein [Nitrososphaera sp.]|nr:FRG domain-containing protein [Nitrososphaera sp.]
MNDIYCVDIHSVKDLFDRVAEDTAKWTHDGFARPWFRGHTDIRYKLLPSILRCGNDIHEFNLTKKFRLMAPGFGAELETGRLDRWLFLMQHHRAPTRLLDWTESVLVAAFFATEKAAEEGAIEHDAAVIAMDPIALNNAASLLHFPVTWSQNPVLQTIKFAFGTQGELINGQTIPFLELPSAIYPSTIHARIASQKGCFTLHGSDKRDFECIFSGRPLIQDKHLIKYRIPKDKVCEIFQNVWDLGITYATLFPDLDGLAKDLKYNFGIKG